MKHADFLKALKTLKSRLMTTQKQDKNPSLSKEKNAHKIYCTCRDSNGDTKYLYTSQKELEYLLASKTITLYAYPCPYEKGWHLTKR